MKRTRNMILAIAAAALCTIDGAKAQDMPREVGQCVSTSVQSVETRLVDGSTQRPIPGSGSAIRFTNGGYQVSYDTVPEIERSRSGDPVRVCLISIPTGCPRNDNRGRVYHTTNLRTQRSWELPNSEHMCGGA